MDKIIDACSCQGCCLLWLTTRQAIDEPNQSCQWANFSIVWGSSLAWLSEWSLLVECVHCNRDKYNYFKHMVQYDDGPAPTISLDSLHSTYWCDIMLFRLAEHMQHSGYGHLSQWDMVGRQGEVFSIRVLHYASWHQAVLANATESSVIYVLTHLGLPAIFFTHSAADFQWPEMACSDNPDSRTTCTKAVIQNPTLADLFFYHKVKAFYTRVLD